MKDYDVLDTFFCNNLSIGKVMRRMYAYFKKHTAITDAMHVSLGLGIGLLFAFIIISKISKIYFF